MMGEFRIKTLRCEWQVVIQIVDQYGCAMRDSRVVLASWPTADEAYQDLPNHGSEHKYVMGRWIPDHSISAYEWLEVQYREVEIKDLG
jgi:hypothetical protein